MMVFDATKAPVDANDFSLRALLPLEDALNPIADAGLHECRTDIAKSAEDLRDAPGSDDRQMLAPAAMLDTQSDHRTGSASNKSVRSSARRSATALALTVCPVTGAASLDRARGESMLLAKKVAVL
jgi:hypothetical protein